MGPQFNWGGVPSERALPRKAMKVIISISDLIQRGGEHMFRIWTCTGLPSSPAKHDLYPFAKIGNHVAACLLTEKNKLGKR